MTIKWVGAHPNNYNSRYNNKIDKVILHWIVGTLESADATFNNPSRLASAHYGVGGTRIHQYVKEEDCAWHAGNLLVNRQSIGIECEGGPDLPISEDTYRTCAWLVRDICNRYQIPLSRTHIKGHKEVSDKPTQCPGTLDIDRIISLASNDMTDDQKRALEALERFKTQQGHGNLEGAINALTGAYKDFQTLKKDVEGLKQSLTSLEKRVDELNAKLVEKEKTITDYQKEMSNASKQIADQTEVIDALTKDRADYKRWYEAALEKTADKLDSWELFRLLITKLSWRKSDQS